MGKQAGHVTSHQLTERCECTYGGGCLDTRACTMCTCIQVLCGYPCACDCTHVYTVCVRECVLHTQFTHSYRHVAYMRVYAERERQRQRAQTTKEHSVLLMITKIQIKTTPAKSKHWKARMACLICSRTPLWQEKASSYNIHLCPSGPCGTLGGTEVQGCQG